MKVHEITAYDDLDRVEKDSKTRAARTRFVGLDGVWVEIDVTEEHDAELSEVVGRYMRAGVKPEKVPRPPSRKIAPSSTGRTRAEAIAENKALLAFAMARGLPYTPAREGSGVYFPKDTREAYAADQTAREAVAGGR